VVRGCRFGWWAEPDRVPRANVGEHPTGVHVFGRFGDEALLFRLAAQIEEAQPWAHLHPDQTRRALLSSVGAPVGGYARSPDHRDPGFRRWV